MLVAQELAEHRQRLTLHRFGLCQFAILVKLDCQIGERPGDDQMLVT